MATPVYENGTLFSVWYKVGSFSDGKPKLKRAQFDVLQWAPTDTGLKETFVVPLGISRVTDEDLNDIVGVAGSDTTEVGQEFGYYSERRYVIDPSEHDGSDTIFGQQGFGYI